MENVRKKSTIWGIFTIEMDHANFDQSLGRATLVKFSPGAVLA